MEEARVARFWEVDALRGFAVLAMLASNALLDLALFRGAPFTGPGFVFLARATALAFVALLGLSLHLRAHRRPFPPRAALRRAAQLAALALAITTITLLAFPDAPILFGVLHFAAAATLLCYPLRFRPRLALALAAPILLAGLLLNTTSLTLLPLTPATPPTLDYFSLLPWLGIALAGLFAGARLYPRGQRAFWLPDAPRALRPVQWLGRHSLLVYAIHQPVLVALLL